MIKQKGIVIIFILLLLILISLMSISLFNKSLLSFKVADRRSQKELVLYETEGCLSQAEISIIDLSMPNNGTPNFSPIDFNNVSEDWWKNNGIACGDKVLYYIQLLQSFPDKNDYFYQITAHHLKGITLQVVISKNFTTDTTQKTSWVNFS
jgi:hypothetical protein